MEGTATVGMEAPENASRKEEVQWQEIRRKIQALNWICRKLMSCGSC